MDLQINSECARAATDDDKSKVQLDTNSVATNETGDLQKHFQKNHLVAATPAEKPLEQRTRSNHEFTRKELLSNECQRKQTERLEELERELGQADEDAEILDMPLPFRRISQKSSLTNLHNLYQQCPPPQPPLTYKQMKTFQLNEDQAQLMTEQVRKMKNGMERLQEIIKKFNCTEKFKQDVEFIRANVGSAIARAEKKRRSQQTVCNAQGTSHDHTETECCKSTHNQN